MKKLAMAAVAALVMTSAFAQTPPTTGANTLWGQEGRAPVGTYNTSGFVPGDGYMGINGKQLNGGYTSGDDKLNWLNQGGSATYSAVYSWDGSAWVSEDSTGDGNLDIEADIEMYYADTISGNKMYFHLGNLYAALASPANPVAKGGGGHTALTAYIQQTCTTNHPMYVGFSFPSTGTAALTADDFETVSGGTALTGVVRNAMVGSTDIGGRPVNASFPIKLTRQEAGTGEWVPPLSYGLGAHETQTALWWPKAPTGGARNYEYKVELMPGADQPDGNYNLDPIKVVAPEL